MHTKVLSAVTKVVDEETGRIHAVVSTEDTDRDGDIMRASGWELEHFNSHPVLLASHNYFEIKAQIGTWEDMSVKGKQLEGTARYYIGEGNEDADWAFKLASKGQAAYSVGFIPDMAKAQQIKGGMEFLGQELLEVSHVTVPSNRQALQTAKAKGLHPALEAIVDDLLKDAPDDVESQGHLYIHDRLCGIERESKELSQQMDELIALLIQQQPKSLQELISTW